MCLAEAEKEGAGQEMQCVRGCPEEEAEEEGQKKLGMGFGRPVERNGTQSSVQFP